MQERTLEKILVAVDLTEPSENVLEQAIHIAERDTAEISLLWVDDVPHQTPVGFEMFAGNPDLERMRVEMRREAMARLEELAARVRARDIPVTSHVEAGHPDEAIAAHGERIGANLVVIGTRGLTGLKRVLLGSVAEKVVRASLASVLVVRGPVQPLRRVLVATDFSIASERALQVAAALVAPDGHIDLLHVMQDPPGVYLVDPEAEHRTLGDLRDELARRVDTLGAAMVARYGTSSRTVRFRREPGAPREVIQSTLEAGSYDLVAMGTHGFRGFRRFLLGSVAEATLRHAPCSVLVAHNITQDAS